jgi:hypothetical protein
MSRQKDANELKRLVAKLKTVAQTEALVFVTGGRASNYYAALVRSSNDIS